MILISFERNIDLERNERNDMFLDYHITAMLIYIHIYSVASKPGGPGGAGGALAPPLFCHAVSNENNMKNIEITNGLIFKKYVAFLTSRLPMICVLDKRAIQ